MKKRALISVSDKTGLVEFAKSLSSLDFEIVSTGGTKKVLDEAGIKTIGIEEVTGFPEILDGRVKTLHPMVHGGLLARRDKPEHMETLKEHGIVPIDLVYVNLYPFKKTLESGKDHDTIIENIDIGGPSLVRSAAKNYASVTVLTDPNDFEGVLKELQENGDTTLATREKLAAKAFCTTAQYDTYISTYLTEKNSPKDSLLPITSNNPYATERTRIRKQPFMLRIRRVTRSSGVNSIKEKSSPITISRMETLVLAFFRNSRILPVSL